jgi:hypothetical protein
MRKRMWLLVLLAGSTAAVLMAAPVAKKSHLSATLESELRDHLRDPGSAQFRGEFLSLSDNQAEPVKSLCGELNAKNGMGGYTGFAHFIISETGVVVLEQSQPSGFAAVWATWCARPL